MSAPGAGVICICELLRAEFGPFVRAANALTTEPTFLAPTVEEAFVCTSHDRCLSCSSDRGGEEATPNKPWALALST